MKRKIYTEDHELFRISFRRFIEAEIAPNLEQWKKDGIIDRELYIKAGDQGFLAPWADPKYGGLGLDDIRYEMIACEESARLNCSEVGFLLHSWIIAPYINGLGTEDQKQRYLPDMISGQKIAAVAMTEPNVGSDLASMQTRAVNKGNYWVLNGAKTYISNGILSDIIIVAARTNNESRYGGIGLFIVDGDSIGLSRGRNLDKIGLKSQDTAELFFDDVKVSNKNVLGAPDKGFYNLMRFLVDERLLTGIGALATSRAALETTITYTKERQVFGKSIASFQNSQFVLAKLSAELDMLQTYIDEAVIQRDEGTLTADDASRIKYLSTEFEGRLVDQCLQLHGGFGYMMESPIANFYVNARITRIFAGSNEIMLQIIAKGMGLVN